MQKVRQAVPLSIPVRKRNKREADLKGWAIAGFIILTAIFAIFAITGRI